MRGENRRLLLNGFLSNAQCIHRYPRVNGEMMAKNRGQGTGTPETWLSREGVPLPHTPCHTHSGLRHGHSQREHPASTAPTGTGREGWARPDSTDRDTDRGTDKGRDRSTDNGTAGSTGSGRACSLAVCMAAPGLPGSKVGPEPSPRTSPGVSKPFLNARISVPLSIFNHAAPSN